MKSYSKENYGSYHAFQIAIADELRAALVGHDAEYKGCLVSIDDFKLEAVYFDAKPNDVINVYLGDESHPVFFLAVKSGNLKLAQDDLATVEELRRLDDAAQDTLLAEAAAERERLAEVTKQAKIDRERREAAAAEAKAAKERERKYQDRVNRKLAELERLKPEETRKTFDTQSAFYEAIGWMAGHCVSLRAAMPDYMEKWFDGKFDADYKYVVDSKKRTSGGNPTQWGLSFRMTFDAPVVGILELRSTGSNKKAIDSVPFVWDLVDNYGFRFMKGKQDVERIKAEVPDQYAADFEKGLSM